MRELITLSVGQAGNAIGTAFWRNILLEHGLSPDGDYIGDNPNQIEKIGVFFDPS